MRTVPKKNVNRNLWDVKPPEDFTIRRFKPKAKELNISKVTSLRHEKVVADFAKPKDEKIKFSRPMKDVSGLRGFGRAAPPKVVFAGALTGSSKRKSLAEDMPVRVRPSWMRWTLFAASGGVVAALIFYGVGVVAVTHEAKQSGKDIYADIEDSIESLKALKPGEASASLKSASEKYASLESTIRGYGLFNLSAVAGTFIPILSDAGGAFQNLESFFTSAVELSNILEDAKQSGFSYFMSGDGDKVISILKGLQASGKDITESASNLLATFDRLKASPFGNSFDSASLEEHLGLINELYGADDIFGKVIPLLEQPTGFHLAIFFQNPSEMRASGGFIGSYADLFIKNGALDSIDVRDIYDPDGQLDVKVVPPKPLQAITTSWGARDANWFMDFPTSASKVLTFLELSKMYSEKGVTFEGALAINTNVIEDVLELTGPIPLPDYKLTLSRENFLEEVQKEVEAGQNKILGKPKQILKDFAPLLIERIKNLDADGKSRLIGIFENRAQSKDIQVYFKDKTLESFAAKYELGGALFPLTAESKEDYLAVAATNVAGGKTDILIKQALTLKSVLSSDGGIENTLTIARTHVGQNEKYSWYRADNQSYLKLYVPLGSVLETMDGTTSKQVYPKVNYAAKGYATDTDVVLLEASSTETGRTVFGAWLTTPAGETRTATFRYTEPKRVELKAGVSYTFVFDKQSAVNDSVDFEFEAPAGYKWQESDKPVYILKSKTPEKRIMITLTLQDI